MKKLFVCMVAAALAAVMVAGCSSGASASAASGSTTSENASSASSGAVSSESASPEASSSDAASSEAPMAGGWEASFEASALLTAEQKEAFEKATSELDGVDYEPIAVVGTQVVSGMNYAYLCKATVVAPDAKPTWNVAVIYEDPEGRVFFTGAKEIDIADVQTADTDANATMTGGWSVPDPAELVDLPASAQKALDSALEEYTGVDVISPVALLGTQVVAGANYKVLFVGKPVIPDADNALYVATVYQDPQGKCEISDVGIVDLAYYVTEDVA